MLLLVGLEVSPAGGHFLAFGIEREIDHAGLSEPEIAAGVRRAGALGFAAHPFSEGSRMSRTIGRPHPWGALESEHYTGIELWSLETEAAEAWRSPGDAIAFMRHPERSLVGPPARNLAEWDRLCRAQRVVGIGGLDAHQTGLRLGKRVLSPFPNRRFFHFLRTHVLLERPPSGTLEADRAAVYEALGAGRCFLAMDALADARGFLAYATGRVGRRLEMGAEAGSDRGWTIEVRSPRSAELRLLRDGAELRRAPIASELSQPVPEPGVYRVEAWLDQRRWIVANPIYLRRGGHPPAAEPEERDHGARDGNQGDHP